MSARLRAVGAAALVLGIAVVTFTAPPPALVAGITSETSCALVVVASGIALTTTLRGQR